MLFSGIPFLYWFLPAVLLVYFAVPRQFKNYVLLLSSLLFYFCGEPKYTLLLIFSSLVDYAHSLIIEKYRGRPAAKAALISSVVINLLLLGFFKYADFIISNINLLTGASIPLPGLTLPIGISFFTFQTMSYTIDVYRGEVKAEKNLATLATYVCLFPQLIAGPIVRYIDVANELDSRTHSISMAAVGVRRFVAGLAKKVIIANSMGELCEIFRKSDEKTVLFYWIYAAAFTLQIYFDFSGYSDMAIGMGKILGFKFLENFNYPYISKSVTEFWRRWHMSLGTWFRDYVYIPLGGNRTSKLKWLRNIVIVWFLTGLWHGAEWNFVIWGLMYGALLIIEKLALSKLLGRLPGFLSYAYVLLITMIGFVIFNAASLGEAGEYIRAMFGFGGVPLWGFHTFYYLRSYAAIFIIAAVGATPLPGRFYDKLVKSAAGGKILTVLEPVSICALTVAVTAFLVDGSYNPFLYFRF